ncbi:RDS2 [[Candida] subhashii]|uniref:RDS2 n=1 Tax=[Candida] subhashii TaxID=561895 RepID=A0A8J5UXW9_9ASCO|nr:RDS2 [[Candida] subhashii]KAG7662644.1 RDS2 [[Candida] subhashii]
MSEHLVTNQHPAPGQQTNNNNSNISEPPTKDYDEELNTNNNNTTLDLSESLTSDNDSGSKSSKAASKRRKKKVEIACVYCRRSHMICDESRPCQRCIKRGIGHLCYDEPSNTRQRKKAASLRKTQSEGGASTISSSSSLSQPQPHAAPLRAMSTLPPIASQADIKVESVSYDLQYGQQQQQQQQHQQQQPQQQQQLQQQPQQPPKQQQQQLPQPQQYQSALQPKTLQNSVLSQTLPYNQEPFFYSEHAGSEFSSLNDFLSMIDDPELVQGALTDDPNAMLNFPVGNNNNINQQQNNFNDTNVPSNNSITNLHGLSFSPNANLFSGSTFPGDESGGQNSSNNISNQQPLQQSRSQSFQQLPPPPQSSQQQQQNNNNNNEQPVISDSARDKFFLTAADPTTEISPEERLKQVIKAKLEAGLLQPYNYAKGYARLQNYMDNYMNISSRQRILKPLSIFRPAFRAIARTLKDVDLVLVEESFERMLLDYDRVFTSMAIPACLWRRTGEIYRGNKEFASLVGVTADDLKDGKLAIYELMSEESAVNFWEKYGAIAFDKGQKAVLTSCNLRTKDGVKRKSCCFSFTIRRDRYNIPSCIVGNFIPIDP